MEPSTEMANEFVVKLGSLDFNTRDKSDSRSPHNKPEGRRTNFQWCTRIVLPHFTPQL